MASLNNQSEPLKYVYRFSHIQLGSKIRTYSSPTVFNTVKGAQDAGLHFISTMAVIDPAIKYSSMINIIAELKVSN